MKILLFVICACLGFAGVVSLQDVERRAPSAERKIDEPARSARRPPPSRSQLQGVASCSATPCHGGNGPGNAAGTEYTTWINEDKHARAYEVLFNKRSRRMVQWLDSLAEFTQVHPENDSRCLGCHIQPHFAEMPRRKTFSRQDGVGCEACHGPAEQWLSEHYTAAWKNLTVSEKERHGMRATKALPDRVRVCVDCHIGQLGNEVTHDLIAAGHPVLRFEFSWYEAHMPPHWNEAKGTGPAWAIGQVVASERAVKLIAQRAADTHSLWPEFADYDCFSCHHGLEAERWRRPHDVGSELRVPGSLTLGHWYSAMTRILAGEYSKAHLTSLSELRQHMSAPTVNRAAISSIAKKLDSELSVLVENIQHAPPAGPDVVQRRFDLMLDYGFAHPIRNWEAAGQLYLGLRALHQAWKDLAGNEVPSSIAPSLKDMAAVLAFPNNYDSPVPDFAAETFRRSLESLQKRKSNRR